MSDDGFVSVTPVQEITGNKTHCFTVNGVGIVLCSVDGNVYAVENKCSHADSTFDRGRVRRHKLLCPLHGAIFDVRDGSVLGAPAFAPIRSYPVRIEDGQVQVKIEA